ncbi:hypothetical protein NQ314_009023 [Rhamnusium bicolor]|uniref:Glutamine amidotransferase domain-containing protein n=1 Tax=Rhamnusium bicolor TaxID=1586634 RepID=A0AAV8Y6G9_9CUCU|nr:hypothetical protein NQ314_009023 [Rhamnusium bicolor]
MQNYKKSKLFSNAPESILNVLASHNVTYNQHHFCLTQEVLKQNKILSDWKILSTNRDSNNLEFISSMESVSYPIYGVQFHPEKNQFEFKKSGIPHSIEAVYVSQYFANFFVNECRKIKIPFPV